jgi:hypothetical protein
MCGLRYLKDSGGKRSVATAIFQVFVDFDTLVRWLVDMERRRGQGGCSAKSNKLTNPQSLSGWNYFQKCHNRESFKKNNTHYIVREEAKTGRRRQHEHMAE